MKNTLPLLLLLLSAILLAQPFHSSIPLKMQKELCKRLAQNDTSTNRCDNGSTIQYKTHFFTKEDNILLFLYLEEHTLDFRHYTTIKVPILIDKKGQWHYAKGKNAIREDIQQIIKDPNGNIWMDALWGMESAVSEIYFTKNGSRIKQIVLPKSTTANGYYEGTKEICFQKKNIVLTFYPFWNVPEQSWQSSYSKAISKTPQWKAVATKERVCLHSKPKSKWHIKKKGESISFTHIDTKVTLNLPFTPREKKYDNYYVQLGAFKQKFIAQKIQEQFKTLVYYPQIRKKMVKKKSYFKLLIGPFNSKEKAKFLLKSLEDNGTKGFIYME